MGPYTLLFLCQVMRRPQTMLSKKRQVWKYFQHPHSGMGADVFIVKQKTTGSAGAPKKVLALREKVSERSEEPAVMAGHSITPVQKG